MNIIDRQQRLLSPDELAQWTDAHRRTYARRFPNSWPKVRARLALSELAIMAGWSRPSRRDAPATPSEAAGEAPPQDIAPAPYVPIVFGKSFDPGRPGVSIAEIVEACARYAQVSVAELKSARRARHICRPRQAAMYIATKHTDRSLPEIARRIGKKDHSTVMHARNKVQDDLAAGGEVFGEIVPHVERELGLRDF